MLEFDKETACCWAGPFYDVWAYYAIEDGVKFYAGDEGRLPTMKERREQLKYSQFSFPWRFNLTNNSVMDDHKIETLLAQMTKKELLDYEDRVENGPKGCFTVENPFGLYMCGNDDTSYTKFYPSLEDLQKELALFEACQPLNMWKDLQGFVFTN